MKRDRMTRGMGVRAVAEVLEGRRLLAAALLEVGVAPAGSEPRDFVEVNGTLYFTADDGVHGRELWKSDGTAAGTVMVKDISVGYGSDISQMVGVDGKLFFRVGVAGMRTVWVSDGTGEGTFALTDDARNSSYDPDWLTSANGLLLFIADDGVRGPALWKSDGTREGTGLVRAFPGKMPWDQSGVYTTEMVGTDGLVFFRAKDPSYGEEVWASDGTAEGTRLVRDIVAGTSGSWPSGFMAFNGKVLFRANGGLWQSDGTEGGTRLVMKTAYSPMGRYGRSVEVDGLLYFDAISGSDTVLMRTDGTSGGTVVLKKLKEGTESAEVCVASLGGRVYFAASSEGSGAELWETDGTVEGTVMVRDMREGILGSKPGDLRVMNGELYFTADGDGAGRKLWRSDGTEAGTARVGDVEVAKAPSMGWSLAVANGKVFFGGNHSRYGNELWRSDGTTEGTVMVEDLWAGSVSGGFNVWPVVVMGRNGYFEANDGYHGQELFKTDGTAAGTGMVKDAVPGKEGGLRGDRPVVEVNGTLFFFGSDANSGLWKSDGTESGTGLVKEIRGTEGAILWNSLAKAGSVLLFTIQEYASGEYTSQLWRSDGTEAGTVMVKKLGSSEVNLVSVGNVVYFSASVDGKTGLWRSDGTAGGTYQVKTGVDARDLRDVGGVLFFGGYDSEHGLELWRSNGTAAGTRMVKDILPGTGSGFYSMGLSVGQALFYVGRTTAYGYELWKSDGTEEGTVMVKDIAEGVDNGSPLGMAACGGVLYFSADDGVHGRELWKSDGTEVGTAMVKDVNPGKAASGVGAIASVGGEVYFGASDGVHGQELWRSDGTEAGTEMVMDLAFGGAGSSPRPFDLNGQVMFTADDGFARRELWRWLPDELGGGVGADEYLVRRAEEGPYVQVYGNADVAWTIAVGTFGRPGEPFGICGEAGNDRMVLDFASGSPVPVYGEGMNGLVIDGGEGEDVLVISGTHGADGVTVAGDFVRVGEASVGVSVEQVVLGTTGGEMEIGVLRIEGGARIENAARSLRVGEMELEEGSLDIGSGELVIEKAELGEVEEWISSGRGLISSAAEGSVLTGLAAVAKGSGVRVRYTWNGDANVDGVIDADDYFLADSGFITQVGGWGNGDFNYDGVVDADDYLLIDSAFIGQSGKLGEGEVRLGDGGWAIVALAAGEESRVQEVKGCGVWEEELGLVAGLFSEVGILG